MEQAASPDEIFEGTEKKLELLVRTEQVRLRELGRPFWEQVVASARASVLSVQSTNDCDAYLLSESSLFVTDDQATMITCGTTQLVDAVRVLLAQIDHSAIEYLIYQRRNDYFPDQQPTTFFDDAKAIASILPGSAYRFGDQDDHYIYLFCTDRAYTPNSRDSTLEVLMHGVNEEVTREFIRPEGSRKSSLPQRILGDLVDGFSCDEYFFSPPGYSMNAIRGATYFTIHVTRQRLGSYVSFETNHADCQSPANTIDRLLEFFGPRSFDVLSFLPGGEHPIPAADLGLDHPRLRVRDYVHELLPCGYDVTFQHHFIRVAGPRRPLRIDLPGPIS